MTYKAPMYKKVEIQYGIVVKRMVDRIIISGKMSRQDHKLLTSMVLASGDINDTDRRQINRIFDYIQTGQLKLIDW
ncbi:MAG: hypothetical protein KME60_25190 [Cyanomargarita calcarea GSE-NOS-MK-12-04C]|jgi:hypothetical protein|uniref:Uncharacterized protein n=1 Tax=Cyanomargarita calcarea GSE-NOS-MK-12-04C TaxID=2839659 RepID=A0A951QRK1_9CYAN|nr:hypothetical protein [Cyanomargarita calcarea GSE-NOS-MK-12-04C]